MATARVSLSVLVVMVLAAGLGGFAMAIAVQPQSTVASPAVGTVLAGVDSVAGIGSVNGSAIGADAARATAVKRDFLFQIVGYETLNQGGQKMNLYFNYRYDEGIATADIPNYLDIRAQVVEYMRHVDTTDEPYWETVDLQLCTRLKENFPIEAISCQLQVYPDDRVGLPYEPGYHGSTTTIGDIEPLAFAGPLTTTP